MYANLRINNIMDSEPTHQWYYKITYFFVANQVLFKRLVVVLLLLFNLAIWWPAAVKLVNYGADTVNYQHLLNEFSQNTINWADYRARHQPVPIEIVTVDKMKTSEHKYDLVAKVHNPNAGWHARTVNYAFVVDGFILDWQNGFVLPEQDKYLFNFSYFSESNPGQIDLKFGDIGWQRVKEKDRMFVLKQIAVENKNFETNNNISQIKFEAVNNSPFGFWQVGWQVVLSSGARPVGINYVTANGFLSGEFKRLSATWGETMSMPSKIEVLPDIDVFDETNYITETKVPAVNLIKGARTQK